MGDIHTHSIPTLPPCLSLFNMSSDAGPHYPYQSHYTQAMSTPTAHNNQQPDFAEWTFKQEPSNSISGPSSAELIKEEPDDHRKRKRNRTIRSCVPCHNHKRKCDRKRPCSRCTALGLVSCRRYLTRTILTQGS